MFTKTPRVANKERYKIAQRRFSMVFHFSIYLDLLTQYLITIKLSHKKQQDLFPILREWNKLNFPLNTHVRALEINRNF